MEPKHSFIIHPADQVHWILILKKFQKKFPEQYFWIKFLNKLLKYFHMNIILRFEMSLDHLDHNKSIYFIPAVEDFEESDWVDINVIVFCSACRRLSSSNLQASMSSKKNTIVFFNSNSNEIYYWEKCREYRIEYRIMKIMLTDIHGIIIIMSWKLTLGKGRNFHVIMKPS